MVREVRSEGRDDPTLDRRFHLNESRLKEPCFEVEFAEFNRIGFKQSITPLVFQIRNRIESVNVDLRS